MENPDQDDFLAGSDSDDSDSRDSGDVTTQESSSSSSDEEDLPIIDSNIPTFTLQDFQNMTNAELRHYDMVRIPAVTDLAGKVIECMIGPAIHFNTIIWLVKFQDKVFFDLIHGGLMNIHFPAHTIRYYERRIKWLPGTTKYKSRKLKNFIVDLSTCASVLMFNDCMKNGGK